MAALAAAATARADVFVPDDPAPRAAECVSAAGGLVVTARRRTAWIVEVSEDGGRPRRVATGGLFFTCPRVAAAADGTAVIDMGAQVLVRRPGGDFGPPLDVGRDVQVVDIAAAPGGWVAVVGHQYGSPSAGTAVVARIFRPDGSSSSAELDRAPGGSPFVSFLSPRIGIDARGAATAAWTYAESASGRYEQRSSSSPDAASWTPARTFSQGADPIFVPADRLVDVAVSPSGRTLLAWGDGRGMQASVDGGPPKRLSFARTAGSPAASIADDGTAFVAYAARRVRVVVNDRRPDGTWSEPRLLARPFEGANESPNESEPQQVALAGVLAADGRGAVMWTVYGPVAREIVAVSGRAGAWSPINRVSLITRDAVSPSLSLGPSGDPRLAWLEMLTGQPRRNRVRASRLVAEASDRTAPVVTTRLPSRSRTATVRIPVSCSETCDARVRLINRFGAEIVGKVRKLGAGARTVVRLRPPAYYVREMRAHASARRLRAEVLATDRQGNVARASRRVRFR